MYFEGVSIWWLLMSNTYATSKCLYVGEVVIRYCESSVPLLLLQAHFSGVAGGTVTTLVKSPCRGKPACTWLLLDRRSFGIPIPVPCLPKSPLCSGLVVFAWMHRDTDPWEEKLAWWLTLSKVTSHIWGLQETSNLCHILI